MQQNVLTTFIRNDEAIPLGDIKPFDAAGNFKKFNIDVAVFGIDVGGAQIILKCHMRPQSTDP
jgi:hypothetical protein